MPILCSAFFSFTAHCLMASYRAKVLAAKMLMERLPSETLLPPVSSWGLLHMASPLRAMEPPPPSLLHTQSPQSRPLSHWAGRGKGCWPFSPLEPSGTAQSAPPLLPLLHAPQEDSFTSCLFYSKNLEPPAHMTVCPLAPSRKYVLPLLLYSRHPCPLPTFTSTFDIFKGIDICSKL